MPSETVQEAILEMGVEIPEKGISDIDILRAKMQGINDDIARIEEQTKNFGVGGGDDKKNMDDFIDGLGESDDLITMILKNTGLVDRNIAAMGAKIAVAGAAIGGIVVLTQKWVEASEEEERKLAGVDRLAKDIQETVSEIARTRASTQGFLVDRAEGSRLRGLVQELDSIGQLDRQRATALKDQNLLRREMRETEHRIFELEERRANLPARKDDLFADFDLIDIGEKAYEKRARDINQLSEARLPLLEAQLDYEEEFSSGLETQISLQASIIGQERERIKASQERVRTAEEELKLLEEQVQKGRAQIGGAGGEDKLELQRILERQKRGATLTTEELQSLSSLAGEIDGIRDFVQKEFAQRGQGLADELAEAFTGEDVSDRVAEQKRKLEEIRSKEQELQNTLTEDIESRKENQEELLKILLESTRNQQTLRLEINALKREVERYNAENNEGKPR